MSGRILVVDDVATNRIVLKARLTAAFYDVALASDGAEALRCARANPPDVILMDARMPGIDGFAACRLLKQDPVTRHVPVVVVTAADDPGSRMRALAAGADDFLSKPVNEAALFARLRSLLREKGVVEELRQRARSCQTPGLAEEGAPLTVPGKPALVQILCRNPALGQQQARRLAPLMRHRICVTTPREVFSSDHSPDMADVILLCQDTGRGGGPVHDLLAELRSRRPTRDAAIIVVLPDGDMAGIASVMDLGASDYVFAGSDALEVAARICSQLRRKRYLDGLRATVQHGLRLAVTDPLTGLHNRRFALGELARIAATRVPAGHNLAVLLIDIDRFKTINDRFGHQAGDSVLAAVATRIAGALRDADLLARYGGEEFLAVFTAPGSEAACALAERLRGDVANTPFPLPCGGSLTVTLSVGVAIASGPGPHDPAALVAAADRALYRSKTAGRNSVRLAAPAA